MIECRVCSEPNDGLAVTCTACGGFLQAKVEALDLFATIGGLIESPAVTMRRIALSRRKNYVFVLSAIAGVFGVCAVFWAASAGEWFDTIFSLMGAVLLAGPPAGVCCVLAIAGLLVVTVRVAGGKGSYRNLLAVVAYAASPIAVAAVVVLPLTFALFGPYYFGSNPPPFVINPAAFVVLTGLDVLALVWSWFLLVRGTAVAGRLTAFRAFAASLVVPLIFAGSVAALHLFRTSPA